MHARESLLCVDINSNQKTGVNEAFPSSRTVNRFNSSGFRQLPPKDEKNQSTQMVITFDHVNIFDVQYTVEKGYARSLQ